MKELEKTVCLFCKNPCGNEWCLYEKNRRKTGQDRRKN